MKSSYENKFTWCQIFSFSFIKIHPNITDQCTKMRWYILYIEDCVFSAVRILLHTHALEARPKCLYRFYCILIFPPFRSYHLCNISVFTTRKNIHSQQENYSLEYDPKGIYQSTFVFTCSHSRLLMPYNFIPSAWIYQNSSFIIWAWLWIE